MKSAEQIEQSIRELHIEADAGRRERTVRNLVEAHTQQKNRTQAFSLLSYGRIIMRQKPRRAAAVIAAALLLAGLFSLGSGSVAFSQATRAVSSTLSRLKAMITRVTGGTRDTDTTDRPPELEQVPDPNARTVEYGIFILAVQPGKQGIWQYLEDSGIEFVQASAAPETYVAVISRQQAESFDALRTLDVLTTLRCLAGPSFQRRERELAWIVTAGYQEPNDLTSVLAMGWLPTISDDGTEIRSTVSFHDGLNGFEIPNVAMEPGGIVLIRAKGMWSCSDDANTQKESDVLIRAKLNLLQTP
jgi:hypothetical protein